MIEPADYVFVGVGEGFLPDISLCLDGQIFVALAPLAKLKESYRTVRGHEATDLMEVCGYFTGSTLQELKRSMPGDTAWVSWHILKPGEILATPPGYIRAEGDLLAC